MSKGRKVGIGLLVFIVWFILMCIFSQFENSTPIGILFITPILYGTWLLVKKMWMKGINDMTPERRERMSKEKENWKAIGRGIKRHPVAIIITTVIILLPAFIYWYAVVSDVKPTFDGYNKICLGMDVLELWDAFGQGDKVMFASKNGRFKMHNEWSNYRQQYSAWHEGNDSTFYEVIVWVYEDNVVGYELSKNGRHKEREWSFDPEHWELKTLTKSRY